MHDLEIHFHEVQGEAVSGKMKVILERRSIQIVSVETQIYGLEEIENATYSLNLFPGRWNAK